MRAEDPCCFPLGWNTIELIIGDEGDNNVVLWVYIKAMAMGSMVMGSAAMAVGGNGLVCNGCDVDGLDGDGGGRWRATTAAADGRRVVADNRQLLSRGRTVGEVGSNT
jgi:hypothetical protein